MIKVVAGIIYKQNKFLIAKRNYQKSQGGLWEFPGGKVELGENNEEALKREIKEELNIEIEVIKHLTTCIHRYSDKTIELICYKAKIITGEIELLEHEDYKFITTKDFDKYEFAEADKKIFKKLIEKL